MGKKRKPPQGPRTPAPKPPAVLFEADDGDADLFRAYLDFAFKPDKREDPGRTHRALPRSALGPETLTLDLHGKALDEAQAAVDELFARLAKQGGEGPIVTIVTGKGRHSTGKEAVLAREVPLHVRHKWAHLVTFPDGFPETPKAGDAAAKGHFRVKVAPKRGR